MAGTRMATNFDGTSSRVERYRSFLRNVVIDGSPFSVQEHNPKPGMLQNVVYRLPQERARLCSQGTEFSPGSSQCVDVIFRGGAGIRDRKSMTFEIVRYSKLSDGFVVTQPMGSPFFMDIVGNPDHTMEWKVDKEQYMDLRDAIQHGFSVEEAETLMLHFRRRILWLRALLVPCDDARQGIEDYIRNALSAELAKTPVPHDPKEWEAYCHISLCDSKVCKFFAAQWDHVLLQTRVSAWTKLYDRYKELFHAWSIKPA